MVQSQIKKPPSKTSGRKNMRSEDREKLIVSEAVKFFAEYGFEGQTRELAKRMGVSHAVLYRHFESKEALIERVYEHVYLSRWNKDWEALIINRDIPLKQRITQFYIEYAARVFDYEWVRIFIFSGLKSFDLSGRYLHIIRNKFLLPLAIEFNFEMGKDVSAASISELELELFWALHGSIFYIAIRQFVYGEAVPDEVDAAIKNTVAVFFDGAKANFNK